MPFVIGETIGPYRIVEQLGQGGMATVFKAYHAALDRFVAIKALHLAFLEDPTFLARFQREARVVARLEHSNIVPVYDFSEYEGRPYLVMKFIEGETLKARLLRAPLPLETALQVVQAMGLALAYAHKQGILHRDVKPSNVLLARDGQIYLADFGLARIAAAGESTLSSDMVLGTPQYISPEQALGKRDLDAGTDIYSFGVLLYELVVGKVPFSGDTPYAVIHDHIYSPLPLPRINNPSVSEAVERVLLKALAKERADRFDDVAALVSAFCQALQASEASACAEQAGLAHPLPAEPEAVKPPGRLDPVTQAAPLAAQAGQRVTAAAPSPCEPADGSDAPVKPAKTGAPAARSAPKPSAPPGGASKAPTQAKPVKAPAKAPARIPGWLLAAGLTLAACLFLLAVIKPGERLRHWLVSLSPSPTAFAAVPIPTDPPQAVEPEPDQPETWPEGTLYRADFDSGLFPANWIADQGWRVEEGQFCGRGQALAAYQPAEAWQDYALYFRLRIEGGGLHLALRQSESSRYFIALTSEGVMLNKQRGERIQENIQVSPFGFAPGQWHSLILSSQGEAVILIVDGLVVLDFIDRLDLLQKGGFSFETMADASVCFDDLVVEDRSGKPPVNVIYENHFDQPVDEAWQLGPNWGVADGALCGRGRDRAVLEAVKLDDFNANFRLLLSGDTHLVYNLYKEADQRYLARLSTNDSQVTLRQQIEDTMQPDALDVGRMTMTTRVWQEMFWQVRQGAFTLQVDGKEVLDYHAPESFGLGTIAFESLDSVVCIDNLVITLPAYKPNP